MGPQLNLGVEINGVELAVALPLAWLREEFDLFSSKVAELRARDEDPSLLPCRVVRLLCPCCGASPVHLTVVDRDSELMRACRRCRTNFPVGL